MKYLFMYNRFNLLYGWSCIPVFFSFLILLLYPFYSGKASFFGKLEF